jgi:hypothetical protein
VPTGEAAPVARQYHYYGSALLACEIAAKGFPPKVVLGIADKLGAQYEAESDSHTGSSESRMDVELHQWGGQLGLQACADVHDPKHQWVDDVVIGGKEAGSQIEKTWNDIWSEWEDLDRAWKKVYEFFFGGD